MKIGFISDIHSNIFALKEIFRREPHIEKWFCFGDFVGIFPNVNEVIDLLKTKRVILIKGNHEESFRNGKIIDDSYTANESIRHQRKTIHPENIEFIKNLDVCGNLVIDGFHLFYTHALAQTKNKYTIDFSSLQKRYEDYDLVLYGNTHYPLICYLKKLIVVNPGSGGFPIDKTRKASYATVDTKNFAIKIKRFNFNKKLLIESVVKNKYNNKLIAYLKNDFVWK